MKTLFGFALMCLVCMGSAFAANPNPDVNESTAPASQEMKQEMQEVLDNETNITGICYSARGCTGKVYSRSTTPRECKKMGGKSLQSGKTCYRV